VKFMMMNTVVNTIPITLSYAPMLDVIRTIENVCCNLCIGYVLLVLFLWVTWYMFAPDGEEIPYVGLVRKNKKK
jgi:hypothetical protein